MLSGCSTREFSVLDVLGSWGFANQALSDVIGRCEYVRVSVVPNAARNNMQHLFTGRPEDDIGETGVTNATLGTNWEARYFQTHSGV